MIEHWTLPTSWSGDGGETWHGIRYSPDVAITVPSSECPVCALAAEREARERWERACAEAYTLIPRSLSDSQDLKTNPETLLGFLRGVSIRLSAEREAREKAERERDEAQRKLAEVQHDFAKVTPEVIAAQRRLDEARLAFQHQLAERDVQIAAANEMILDLVNQSCRQPDGTLDSQALSTYAEAIEYLERIGKVEVTTSYGRRVIATLKGGKP